MICLRRSTSMKCLSIFTRPPIPLVPLSNIRESRKRAKRSSAPAVKEIYIPKYLAGVVPMSVPVIPGLRRIRLFAGLRPYIQSRSYYNRGARLTTNYFVHPIDPRHSDNKSHFKLHMRAPTMKRHNLFDPSDLLELCSPEHFEHMSGYDRF